MIGIEFDIGEGAGIAGPDDLAGAVLDAVVEVAPEVNVGEDQEALGWR